MSEKDGKRDRHGQRRLEGGQIDIEKDTQIKNERNRPANLVQTMKTGKK